MKTVCYMTIINKRNSAERGQNGSEAVVGAMVEQEAAAASHLAELSRLCSSISIKLFTGVKR